MKLFLLVIASVIVGIGLGVFTTWAELSSLYSAPRLPVGPENTTVVGGGPRPQIVEAPQGDRPIAQADDATYNFGNMELGAHGTHDFTIGNRGQKPLTLTKGLTSCKCTLSKLADEKDQLELAPGEETVVTLAWDTRAQPGAFRVTAEIQTNDPVTPVVTLVIEGSITRSVMMEPEDVVFSSLSPRSTAEATVRFYAMTVENFELQGHVVEDGPLKGLVEVSYEPLPAEELQKRGALGGYLVHLKVKPGLPLGPFEQRILLNTNLPDGAQMSIPVGGRVVSDISVMGRNWLDDYARLVIGEVESAKGAEDHVSLVVRGPHRGEMEFSVAEIDPELLEVELGDPVERGNSIQVPVTVRIPAGHSPIARSGGTVSPYGKILIKATHPNPELKLDEQIRINVSFVITQ